MELQACNTWECVNSFANWVSAIGTILLSAIAVWLSIRDRLVNVRASFDAGLVPGDNPRVLDRQVFILPYTNIGPRPVTIGAHVWSFPLRKARLFFTPQLDPGVARINTPLPAELTDGKTGYIFYPIDFFADLDQPEAALFAANIFVAWMRIHFFRIHLSTSVGKQVKVSVKSNARKRLWDQYRAYRAEIARSS